MMPRYRADGTQRCQDCSHDPEPGRGRCTACAEAHRATEAARVEARRNRGLCVTCGAKAEPDRRYCAACLRYYADRYELARGGRHSESLQHASATGARLRRAL
jgi:predicted CXXCH cytochrome family protein